MAITRKKEQVNCLVYPGNQSGDHNLPEDNVFKKYFNHLDDVTGQLLEAIERSRNIISENEKKR